MTIRSLTRLAPLLLLLDAAEAKDKKGATTAGPTVVPETTMFLRNAFDADPTDYIGNFVMQDGVPPVPDESSATPLACSKYVSWAEKAGGNVHYTETFAATTQASLKVGVPPYAGGSAEAASGSEVLIDYVLTKKWVPIVSDPAGFSSCCAQYPSECKTWYIGEFIGGTGKIYYTKSSGGKAKGGAAVPAVAAQVMVSGGREWVRGFEFNEEVAFAFKLRRSPTRDASSMTSAVAANWDGTQKPTGPEGEYFVGTSPVTNAESVAKEYARNDAMKQAVQWCSSSYTYSASGSSSTSGTAASMTGGAMSSTSNWSTESAGAVNQLRDVTWKIENAVGEMNEPQVRARGLFLLPASSVEACRGGASSSGGRPPSP